MTTRELRRKYLEFFESKGHLIYPSGNLAPYDVTGRLDESLLFNGAGMVQFKPFFRGIAVPPNKRLTTCQKCLRTGDIEEVGDSSHLTFFEMLGNFSFGDYFKADAIKMSWEFLTNSTWLGLDPYRLSFTVFQEDDEAFEVWASCFQADGLAIQPESRIFRLGEDTNYWPAGAFSKGPPGPCGPNSEMFYWVAAGPPPSAQTYTQDDWLRDEADGKWLEIWNDVFIQYEWKGTPKNPSNPSEGYTKIGMDPLPFRSIDTGMGLERTAAVLGGLGTVYDTDAFQPILAQIRTLGGRSEGSPEAVAAERIIADHIRSASFCIADGILPGNSGRGYVLRRLLRRAILKGDRTLQIRDHFLHILADSVIEAMSDHYTDLRERREVILETLRSEEELFRRTLREGSARLQEAIQRVSVAQNLVKSGSELSVGVPADPDLLLPGDLAFQLYDTYGFPLEITQELCREAGLQVDQKGFEAAMREAQERSRGASSMGTVYGGISVTFTFLRDREGGATPTQFVGYDHATAEGRVVGVVPVREEDGTPSRQIAVALDRTPFYAESGGQVADTGWIEGPDFKLTVRDVVKQDGVFVHLAEVESAVLDEMQSSEGSEDLQYRLMDRFFNMSVIASIDQPRRRRITRNHTATHLLHATLRRVLGKHVTQAGSQVTDAGLRFDFTHGKALTPAELDEVEQIVNEEVLSADLLQIHQNVPIAEAKRFGAMALFGEKYGEFVRVVEITSPGSTEPFSVELCGGCHVKNVAEVGLFRIMKEGSAASGVRRIEALTGEGAYAWVRNQAELIADAADKLKAQPQDLLMAVERMLEQLREERRKVEKLRTQGASHQEPQLTTIGQVELATLLIPDGDPQDATSAADRLTDSQPIRVALIGLVTDGRAQIVCKVGQEALRHGVHAGNLVREVSKLVGGGGGGRPDFATAGGRNPESLASALSQAVEMVRAMLKE